MGSPGNTCSGSISVVSLHICLKGAEWHPGVSGEKYPHREAEGPSALGIVHLDHVHRDVACPEGWAQAEPGQCWDRSVMRLRGTPGRACPHRSCAGTEPCGSLSGTRMEPEPGTEMELGVEPGLEPEPGIEPELELELKPGIESRKAGAGNKTRAEAGAGNRSGAEAGTAAEAGSGARSPPGDRHSPPTRSLSPAAGAPRAVTGTVGSGTARDRARHRAVPLRGSLPLCRSVTRFPRGQAW